MKFVKTSRFTGRMIVWDEAVRGARAISETGKKNVVTKEYGNHGAPMLRVEADTFIDMQARGVDSTQTEASVYEIKP